MTSPITIATIKAGLIHPDFLKEVERWGAPIEVPENIQATPQDLESAARAIEEALQNEGQVLMRETDLEVLRQYLNSQTQGVLHVEIFAPDTDSTNFADIPVSFGVTPSLEYIIPYRSDSITEEMTNGMTYLSRGEGSSPKIYFSAVRELFFGDTKAFLLCTPADSVKVPALLMKGGENGSDVP